MAKNNNTSLWNTFKNAFTAEKAKTAALCAEHGIGYGIGYTVTTARDEVGGLLETLSETEAVQALKDGYYEGKADANFAYTQRCLVREEKAIAKANKKALEQAVKEMVANVK